jgi:hypothetical protein
MEEKNINNILLGKMIIENAINFEESLIEILRIEVKRLKQLLKNNSNLEELYKTNSLVRSVIMALTITDEKIRTGIDLCMCNCENQDSQKLT